jgi:hypothetical protein
MSTSTKTNRHAQQSADQKMIDGLNSQPSAFASLMILGKSFDLPQAIAVLQARIAAANTALSARATWQAAVQADRDERAKSKTFVSALRQAVHVAFGQSIDTLAEFGLKPRKSRKVLTPDEKAKAAAKAKATRTARHTLGSKQKAKIKGTVAVTEPATSPAATTPAVAPSNTSPATQPR